MSDPLVTADDLIERHSAVTDMDETEVRAAIADASTTVRDYCDQLLSPGESTHRCKIRNGKAVTPQRPVLSVTSVKDLNGNDVTYTLVNGQINVRTQVFDSWSMEPYRTALSEVDVAYGHGFDPMHDTIVSVVCQVALRTLTSDVADAGVTDEKLGSYGVGYGTVGASGPSGLFAGEKELLRRFRRPLGTMRVAL